jgi:XTP/dITP diphosphohydrolase
MKKIVIASSNPGKIKDFQEIFSTHPILAVPQSEFNIIDVEETGLTFVENAILKARNAAFHSKLPALADDSGLVVDALKGAPGLYSARYAKNGASAEENIQCLLNALEHHPKEDRKAHFYSVIVLLRYADDPAPLIFEGRWDGEILMERRGENGFGYLPIFYVPTHGCSGAELSSRERNHISHRAKAVTQFIEKYINIP